MMSKITTETQERVAEYFGFKHSSPSCSCKKCQEASWLTPAGEVDVLPDFTKLDVQAKWIWPRIEYFNLSKVKGGTCQSRVWVATKKDEYNRLGYNYIEATDLDPGVAMFKAIYKMVEASNGE